MLANQQPLSKMDQLYLNWCQKLGVKFETPIQGGANYDIAIAHQGMLYVSGIIPRIQNAKGQIQIAVTGRVGDILTLAQAQRAAQIALVRTLGILQQELDTLARVEKILRMTVYTQSGQDFTQQSEVADAASAILYEVFSPHGQHTRTSVGVYQLPKNAAVEIDLIVAIKQ